MPNKINGLYFCRPIPALPAMLLEYPHIGHDHPAIRRLAHVINGQQAHLHGSERLHLDPGLADRFHLRAAVHAFGYLAKIIVLVPLIGTKLGQDFSCLPQCKGVKRFTQV